MCIRYIVFPFSEQNCSITVQKTLTMPLLYITFKIHKETESLCEFENLNGAVYLLKIDANVTWYGAN